MIIGQLKGKVTGWVRYDERLVDASDPRPYKLTDRPWLPKMPEDVLNIMEDADERKRDESLKQAEKRVPEFKAKLNEWYEQSGGGDGKKQFAASDVFFSAEELLNLDKPAPKVVTRMLEQFVRGSDGTKACLLSQFFNLEGSEADKTEKSAYLCQKTAVCRVQPT